jgi:hypothetical protein
MGLWGSLVAFQVWDLTTPVQIRVTPFTIKMTENIKYGDENLGYKISAKDMSPEDAEHVLNSIQNDGMEMFVPHKRIYALYKRSKK